jgi:hypothetical protein
LQHAREFLDLVAAGKNDRHGGHVCSSSLSVECPCSWNHRGEMQHPRMLRRSSSISIPTMYEGEGEEGVPVDGVGRIRGWIRQHAWGQRSSLVTETAATSSPLATATSHPPGSQAGDLELDGVAHPAPASSPFLPSCALCSSLSRLFR